MKPFSVGMVVLTSLIGAVGCQVLGLENEGPEGISLEVTGAVWEHGDTIQVMLHNRTDRSLGYNLCVKALERRSGGAWVPVQSMPENTACTLELRVLAAGEEALGGQVVFSFIEGGTYRFKTTVEWPLGDGNVGVTSNVFSIVEP